MSKNNDKMFIVIRLPTSGEIVKLEVSKYNKRMVRGLMNDYGLRPVLPNSKAAEPHPCGTCGEIHKIKAKNGEGTQAAKKMKELSEIHINIVKALRALKLATGDQVYAYINDVLNYHTTSNTSHSRISDLITWQIVRRHDLEGPTKPTGLEYESSAAVAYSLNEERAKIVESDNWQTWRLVAMDNGASFVLEGFAA